MPSTLAFTAERSMPEGSSRSLSVDLERVVPPGKRAAPVSDAELLAEIGRGLTSVYVEFLHQPVPRRTADVLKRIKVALRT